MLKGRGRSFLRRLLPLCNDREKNNDQKLFISIDYNKKKFKKIYMLKHIEKYIDRYIHKDIET